MTSRLITGAGLACLVVGPTALLGQALLTPVSAGGDAADQVADAASDGASSQRQRARSRPLPAPRQPAGASASVMSARI